MKTLKIFVFPICLFLLACDNLPSSSDRSKEIYFNMTALIRNQIQLLDSLRPELKKSILSDQSRESKVIRPEQWSRELYLFQEADINKSAYKGLYALKSFKEQDLQIDEYTAEADQLHTRKLRIVSNSGDHSLLAISISVERENILYNTQKTLTLEFAANAEKRLKNYSIRGKQSSVFGQKNNFDIQGEILYP